jgi:hypothetical protein
VADRGLQSVRLRVPFQPPLMSEAETLENAVAMVERLQGLYLRTLNALQAQRRGRGCWCATRGKSTSHSSR